MSKMADAPHPFTLLDGYAKTAITLGSALLAVSVGVVGKFEQAELPSWSIWLLGLHWILLLAAIGFGIAITGQLTSSSQRNSLANFLKTELEATADWDAHRRDSLKLRINAAHEQSDAAYRWALFNCETSFKCLLFAVALIIVLGIASQTRSSKPRPAAEATDAAIAHVAASFGATISASDLQSVTFDAVSQTYDCVVATGGATYTVKVGADDLQIVDANKK
jgi:hypothetical protein